MTVLAVLKKEPNVPLAVAHSMAIAVSLLSTAVEHVNTPLEQVAPMLMLQVHGSQPQSMVSLMKLREDSTISIRRIASSGLGTRQS